MIRNPFSVWIAFVAVLEGCASVPSTNANEAVAIVGVTEMGGDIDSTRAWQARVKAGTLVAVVQAGRIFSRADLDALLSRVRSAAAH